MTRFWPIGDELMVPVWLMHCNFSLVPFQWAGRWRHQFVVFRLAGEDNTLGVADPQFIRSLDKAELPCQLTFM